MCVYLFALMYNYCIWYRRCAEKSNIHGLLNSVGKMSHTKPDKHTNKVMTETIQVKVISQGNNSLNKVKNRIRHDSNVLIYKKCKL